jgi:tetratricopeptide (TPR) repeat protein
MGVLDWKPVAMCYAADCYASSINAWCHGLLKGSEMNRNMSRLGVLVMVFVFLPVFAPTAYAEKTDDAYKRAAAFSAEGKYGEALPLARKALAEAENQHDIDSIKLTQPLTLLSNIYQKTGDWPSAAKVLERLRSIQESALGPHNLKVASTISALIAVYEKQGDAQQADELNQLAAARWGKQEDSDVDITEPVSRDSEITAQAGVLWEKWNRLAASPNYVKMAALMKDYHSKHSYSKEDFFVCSDMAIEVWDIIKTAGIKAKLMVGNIERDIVKYKSDHEYISEMNHVWVLAEVMPSDWVPVEATAGIIIHPKIPNFELYNKGTSFENPRVFKEFSESRRALFQTCKEANIIADEYNRLYAGKPITREGMERTGRAKQKIEDCKNLERAVLSHLRK